MQVLKFKLAEMPKAVTFLCRPYFYFEMADIILRLHYHTLHLHPHHHVCIALFLSIILFFFLINLFILFIFGCVGSSLLRGGFLQLRQAGTTLLCSAQASHCSGFSCCGAQALGMQASAVVACGLQSTGSEVVAHGLSCSAACGIFPDQGLNPRPLHWQVDF